MCGVLTATNEIRESPNDFETSFTIFGNYALRSTDRIGSNERIANAIVSQRILSPYLRDLYRGR